MFRIGQFSKMSKTTIKALRYYDEIGILQPAHTDQITGYRFYTTDQLIKLHHISSLRQIGLSINQIKVILSGADAQSILQTRKANWLTELQIPIRKNK